MQSSRRCKSEGNVRVIRAEEMGLCFGVRDALKIADSVPDPHRVTIHGELVHNHTVQKRLADRGFVATPENDRGIPATPLVLITAHGISDRERNRLQAAGKQLLDTTCPLVGKVHEAAQMLQAEGYFVIVIGRRGHVEVQGIVEDLDSYAVVCDPSDVQHWPHARLGIVCQTTTPPRLAKEVHEEIVRQNRHAQIRFIDTVCKPTQDRQAAVQRLCQQVDAVIVVGGANSNNTRQLTEYCQQLGTPAFQVESAADLDAAWLAGCETVGLTAGTSTLDETIDEVHQRLLSLAPCCEQHVISPL